MAVKRHQVTFSDGLPLGIHGSFTHEGERWIAVPVKKYTQITTVTDRLLGVIAHARAQLTSWVGTEPAAAQRIVPILATLARGDDAATEKIEAQTS